jgi:hypothetical protein
MGVHTQELRSEQHDGRFFSAVFRAGDTTHTASSAGTHLPVAGALLAERFLIEHELGRGGMGAVFAARDLRMHGRPVAIKCLFATAESGRDGSARMLREAAAAFDHPNVVRIYDVDVAQQFLVMERLEGMSLAARLSRGSFAIDEACTLLAQTLEGLAAVHARGLVHRDLKPDNIFLADDGTGRVVPKILDFGIVKRTLPTQGHWTATQAGMVLGTPAYMAPEQRRAGVVDARADLYALSAVLYELLTLRHPLQRVTGTVEQALTGVPVPPRRFRHELPEALERVVMRGLSVAPEDRYQGALEMLDALRAVAPARAASARPGWLRVALAVVAVVGLASGSMVWEQNKQRVFVPPLPVPVVAQAQAAAEPAVGPAASEEVQTPEVRRVFAPAPEGARRPVRARAARERADLSTTLPSLAGLDEEAAQRSLVQIGLTANQQLADFAAEFGQLMEPAGEGEPGAAP